MDELLAEELAEVVAAGPRRLVVCTAVAALGEEGIQADRHHVGHYGSQ